MPAGMACTHRHGPSPAASLHPCPPTRPCAPQVPRVLALLGAPSPDLRALAVSTLNQLANIMPAALLTNMDT